MSDSNSFRRADGTIEVEADALRLMVGEDGCDLEVSGASMAPTFRTEDRVRVQRDRQPRPGEIAVFINHHQELVAHRLLGRLGNLWLFRGDNRTMPDRPVHTRQVVGRVTDTVVGSTYSPLPAHQGLTRMAFYRTAARRPLRVVISNMRQT